MTIVENIDEVTRMIKEDGRLDLARGIANQAREAMFHGINSIAWRTLMTNFARFGTAGAIDPAQLDRLCGKDADFMGLTWGPQALCYIVANAGCGEPTTAREGTMGGIRFHDEQAGTTMEADLNS